MILLTATNAFRIEALESGSKDSDRISNGIKAADNQFPYVVNIVYYVGSSNHDLISFFFILRLMSNMKCNL